MEAFVLPNHLITTKLANKNGLYIIFELLKRIRYIASEPVILFCLSWWEIIIIGSSVADVDVDIAIVPNVGVVCVRPLRKSTRIRYAPLQAFNTSF